MADRAGAPGEAGDSSIEGCRAGDGTGERGGASDRTSEREGAADRAGVRGGAAHRTTQWGRVAYRARERSGAADRAGKRGGAAHRTSGRGGAADGVGERSGAAGRAGERGGAAHRTSERDGPADGAGERGGAADGAGERGGAADQARDHSCRCCSAVPRPLPAAVRGVERDHPVPQASGDFVCGQHGGGFVGHLALKGTFSWHAQYGGAQTCGQEAQDVWCAVDKDIRWRPDLWCGSLSIRGGQRRRNRGLIWRAHKRQGGCNGR